MKRLFIAIKILPLDRFISMFNNVKLLLKNERITWVDMNNIHLTLKFLGDTDEQKVPQLLDIVREVSKDNVPFEICLSHLGVFGSKYDPKVIWCGLDKCNAMIKTYSELNDKLAVLGIYPDRQNFVPHLTLGRIRNIVDNDMLNKVTEKYKETFFQNCLVENISLYESILRLQGPLYINLSSEK